MAPWDAYSEQLFAASCPAQYGFAARVCQENPDLEHSRSCSNSPTPVLPPQDRNSEPASSPAPSPSPYQHQHSAIRNSGSPFKLLQSWLLEGAFPDGVLQGTRISLIHRPNYQFNCISRSFDVACLMMLSPSICLVITTVLDYYRQLCL